MSWGMIPGPELIDGPISDERGWYMVLYAEGAGEGVWSDDARHVNNGYVYGFEPEAKVER